MNKRVHALYASNMDLTKVLLFIDPDTDDNTAIQTIAQKIQEVETCDIDQEEYYQETQTTPDDFRNYAESIWKQHEEVYLENRFDVTYGLALNVPVL